MPSALRLDDRLRWGLYGVFSVLFVTGVIWLLADALKKSPSGDFWQGISASLLMIHGGAAMVTLVLLGALIPVHVLRGWRSRRNRLAGAAMVIANVLFVATAFSDSITQDRIRGVRGSATCTSPWVSSSRF